MPKTKMKKLLPPKQKYLKSSLFSLLLGLTQARALVRVWFIQLRSTLRSKEKFERKSTLSWKTMITAMKTSKISHTSIMFKKKPWGGMDQHPSCLREKPESTTIWMVFQLERELWFQLCSSETTSLRNILKAPTNSGLKDGKANVTICRLSLLGDSVEEQEHASANI